MKLDFHSTMMDVTLSPWFYHQSMEHFTQEYAQIDPKAKKLQFYSDYFLPTGIYPFAEERVTYYPLTVIYGRGKWKIQWICWDNAIVSEWLRNDCNKSIEEISKIVSICVFGLENNG